MFMAIGDFGAGDSVTPPTNRDFIGNQAPESLWAKLGDGNAPVTPEQPPIPPENPDIVSEPPSLAKRALDAYFDPKPFESTGLYERLGVRRFKRYMPTSGDWVMRNVLRKSLLFDIGDMDRTKRLQTLERFTRMFETIHLGMLAVGNTVFSDAVSNYETPGRAIGSLAWQLGAGVYPIMLQRYNRIRFNRATEKSKKP